MSRALLVALLASGFLLAQTRFDGLPIRSIEFHWEGPRSPVSNETLDTLITLRPGLPYESSRVSQSVKRLYATELFHDIQVEVERLEGRLLVRFTLIPRYLVEEIRFEGQLSLGRDRLRRGLALRSGEPYSDERMQESLVRLGDLYRNHGYYQATIAPAFTVTPDTPRVRVRFLIQAGLRAQVDDLEINIDEGVEPSTVLSWIQTRQAKPFSTEELAQDIQAVESRLSLMGYFNSYVRETVRPDPEKGAVSILLRMVLGNRTPVQLEGLDLTEKELLELPVFGQRSLAPVFLEETRKELVDLYQGRGYLLAVVQCRTTEVPPGNTGLLISVEKGPSLRLGELRFEGNDSVESDILEQIVEARPAGWLQGSRFSSRIVERDLSSLRSFYRLRGFPEATTSHELLGGSADSEALSLVYRISEGRYSRIEEIGFTGNQTIEREQLLREMEGIPGSAFSPSLPSRDCGNILASYANLGFREMDCDFRVSNRDGGGVALDYTIRENEPLRVERLILTGNRDTRDHVIEREFMLRPGGPLSLGGLLETEGNLYNLGIFRRVHVREIPSYGDRQLHNVLVNVEEAPKYTLLYGLGYSSFEGPRGTFGISNNNTFGTSSSLSLGLRGGVRAQRANLAYTLPRPLGRRLPTLVSLTATNEEARTGATDGALDALEGKPFDELRLVASVRTERRLSRRESIFYGYQFERVRIDLPPTLAPPLQFFREEERLRLSSFGLSYLNDSRTDPIDPQGGFLLSGDLRLAGRYLASDEDFFRVLLQGQYYVRLSPNLVFASSLRLGSIFPYGKTADSDLDNPVPISERFFSGGSTSLRGLPQDLAGPLLRDPQTGEVVLVNERGEADVNGRPVPLGGNSLFILNLELRFPLVRFLSGALFYDTGNVFRRTSDLLSELNNAIGLGAQINTPVGVLRFDAGYAIDRPTVAGFDRWNFHLTLGQPF